eukprot:CAMPEP_0202705990 /NCGR_PEP_ID=MMETSP1385-20130828/18481_1 /ASSEMBLY_ACC=CAM_ASM_000861 /TAXON_ID=933848 /ORGANISM="Elphidium margaritaceum" /LENGTH=292 /DNA_ID=CAMNT_0049364357 /DNA_START=63 /DNA_END=941 /DNA_ORIENTATION=+
MAFTSLFVATTCAAFATAAPECSDLKGTWFTGSGSWSYVSFGEPNTIPGYSSVQVMVDGRYSGQCTCAQNSIGISGNCWTGGDPPLYTGRHSDRLVWQDGKLDGVWEKGCNLEGTWTSLAGGPTIEFSGCEVYGSDGTRYCTESDGTKYDSKSATCSCKPNQSGPPSGTCWYHGGSFSYTQGSSAYLYDAQYNYWEKSGAAAYQLEEQEDESNAANSTVTIAAIISGSGLCLVIMVVVAVLFYLKRRKRKQMHFVEDNEKENENADENGDEIGVEVDAETTTGLEKKLNELE